MGQSFDEAFAREFDSLYGYLHRRLGNSAAEDLAADTFAIAYRRWQDLDPARPVRPWLYGIAANLVRHHSRRERRALRAYARTGIDTVLAEDETLVERLDAKTEFPVLAAALAELSVRERDVLLLHAWAELTDSEIAEALALPLGTVKSHLHRARQKVRNLMALSGQLDTEEVRP